MVLPTLCGAGAMIYSLEVRTTLREEPQGQPQDVVEDVPVNGRGTWSRSILLTWPE